RLQAEELGSQNQALRDANTRLASENERLQQQSQSLESLNDSLRAEISRRNEDLLALQDEVNRLRDEVEAQARELFDLQQEAGRFERGDVYFMRDQLIYSGAVDASTPAEAREELAAFIAEATEYVSRRGVERIRVTTEQFNLLVDVITQTPGPDLIRLISPSNQISSTIDVLVEAIENTVLFERGQLIVSTQLHLGSPELPISQDEIRTALANLKADAVRKMRRAGLDEGQLPDFGPVTEGVFTNMLLRPAGPATIGLVATEPVARAGPAPLVLMILSCPPGAARAPRLPAALGSGLTAARPQQVADLHEQLLLGGGLGRGRGGLLRLLLEAALHLVERLDHEEHGERDDQEVDDRVEEGPVLDDRGAGSHGLGHRAVELASAQDDAQVAEVDATDDEADDRHDHLVDERRGDGAEGRADDDRHGQVE